MVEGPCNLGKGLLLCRRLRHNWCYQQVLGPPGWRLATVLILWLPVIINTQLADDLADTGGYFRIFLVESLPPPFWSQFSFDFLHRWQTAFQFLRQMLGNFGFPFSDSNRFVEVAQGILSHQLVF